MIVNPSCITESSEMVDHHQQHQNDQFIISGENNYLKRKLSDEPLVTSSEISNQNDESYLLPKKRLVQIENFNFTQTFDETFNLAHITINNNGFATDCQSIEFLEAYEQSLTPINSAAMYTQPDTTYFSANWDNSDLLELDHRYNLPVNSSLPNVPRNSAENQNTADDLIDCPQMETTMLNSVAQNTVEEKNEGNSTETSTTEQRINAILYNCSLQQKNTGHHQPTRSKRSENEPDFEDKNLSWLFNYKLDELPHLSPEVNRNSPAGKANGKGSKCMQNKMSRKIEEILRNEVGTASPIQTSTSAGLADLATDNEIAVGENFNVENCVRTPKKPPFTYTELIEYALEDRGELTVSGIYQWISDRFPFYKSNDDRWKNSVRHNLSINPHFRKGVKAPQGAGHLWTISSRDSEENALAWEHKKQRLELFFKMEAANQQKLQKHTLNSPSDSTLSSNGANNSNNILYDEAAIAAASLMEQLRNETNGAESPATHIDIPMCQSPIIVCNNNTNNSSQVADQQQDIMLQEEDLKKVAGEILNGIRRNVEVQSIHLHQQQHIISTYRDEMVENGDYLNPISKDDIVNESGLRGNDYYVTEIDPIELGVNMSNVEEEVLFSDEFNLNYFGIGASSDIMA